jgi:hypothetical protein
MQPGGGFFGSMMPQGATSFMPQGASAASMIGGIDGAPSAFMSSPMSPQLMAMLKQLGQQGQQQQGGNNSGGLPPNSFSPFMPGGGQAAPATDGQTPGAAPGGAPGGGAPGGGIMAMLQGMPPDQLKGILSRLGIGGGAGAAAAV